MQRATRKSNTGRANYRPVQQRTQSRLPRAVTANAPFSIGRNRQLLSVPSHSDGLTIQKPVRFNINVSEATANTNITYDDVFTRFLGEHNIQLAANGRLSFSPMWVSFYMVGGPVFASIAVRIFDEPRSNVTAGAFVNTPFFEAVDTSTPSGLCSIRAIVPKAATYSVSADDPANLKALPFVAFGSQTAGQVIVDVGGVFTIKSISGATFA
jgi:hypothetical protein